MRPYTNNHPDALGNGSLTALFSQRLDITTFGTDADALDCINLSYSPEIFPGGLTSAVPDNATVAVAVTTNVITLTVNHRNAAGTFAATAFTITPGAAKVAWSAGAASALSLKDVIDLINEDDAGGTNGAMLRGFRATIAEGGMYDLVVDQTSAGFQAETAKSVLPPATTGSPTSFFKRDMAVWTTDSDFCAFWRLGLPEVKDRGLFKLLDLYGAIGTDTGCTVQVVRDDDEDYVAPTGTWGTDIANHEVVYSVTAANLPAGSGAAANSMEHNPNNASAERGPLVVIVKGDTNAAQTVNLVARMQAVS